LKKQAWVLRFGGFSKYRRGGVSGYNENRARQEALNYLCRAVWRQAARIEGLYYEPENERVRIRSRAAGPVFADVKNKDILSMLAGVLARIQSRLYGGAA
jgi:hypothetical protein